MEEQKHCQSRTSEHVADIPRRELKVTRAEGLVLCFYASVSGRGEGSRHALRVRMFQRALG